MPALEVRMHCTSILAIFLLSCSLAAQQHFIPAQRGLFEAKGRVRYMIEGDYDQDGDVDIACVSSINHYPALDIIELFENTGSGDFVLAHAFKPLEVHALVVSLVWIDIEADGDLDLLVGGSTQRDRLFVLDASGHYSEETQQRLPFALDGTGYPSALDFDGDGAMDFVSANSNGPQLYRNTGTGHFVMDSKNRIPPNTFAFHIWHEDLDGDGDQDLLWFDLNVGLVVAVNNGSGHFLQTHVIAPATPGHSGLELLTADRDGDGDMDMRVTPSQTRTLHILHNLGGMRFSSSQVSGTWTGLASGFSDVDGDFDPDIIAINWSVGAQLLLNDGAATFTPAAAGSLPPLAIQTYEHMFFDMNGDGIDEVLAVSSSSQSIWGRKGKGRFIDSYQTRIPLDTRASYSPLHDLNGDQIPDILKHLLFHPQPVTTVLIGNAHGEFVERQQFPGAYWRTQFADLDGDGDIDFFGVGQGATKDAFFTNDGSGMFTLSPSLAASLSPLQGMRITLGDVDGDGDADAFGTPFFGPGRLLLNMGSGQWKDVSTSHLPSSNTQEAIHSFIDIDKDGDLDLYIGNNGTDFLYRNDGTGHFQDVVGFLPSYRKHTRGVAFSDVDRDGLIDILCRFDDSTWMIKHDALLQLALVENWRIGPLEDQGISGARFADIDGDGYEDLITNASIGSTGAIGAAYYANLGWGKFQHVAEAGIDGSLIMGEAPLLDLDGDGDIDLIVESWKTCDIQLNLMRQVAVRKTPRLGSQLDIEFFNRPGRLRQPTHAITFLDDRLTGPQPLFGRNWYLDLNRATLLPSAVMQAPSGHAQLSIPVPVIPGLAGIELYLQAVFVSAQGTAPAVSAVESFVIPW